MTSINFTSGHDNRNGKRNCGAANCGARAEHHQNSSTDLLMPQTWLGESAGVNEIAAIYLRIRANLFCSKFRYDAGRGRLCLSELLSTSAGVPTPMFAAEA